MQELKVLKNFIVLEGIDGAGTSTQLRLLDDRLRQEEIPHLCTCEPTDNIIGQQIRKVLNKDVSVRPETIALLFAADRHEHIYATDGGILTELEKGKVVISDRYLFSSLAYQSINCDFEQIYALNSVFPLPEHLFFIDTPVGLSQKRLSQRPQQELFDAPSYQEQVYGAYRRVLELFKGTPMQTHILDGAQTIEEIFQEIWAVIAALPVK